MGTVGLQASQSPRKNLVNAHQFQTCHDSTSFSSQCAQVLDPSPLCHGSRNGYQRSCERLAILVPVAQLFPLHLSQNKAPQSSGGMPSTSLSQQSPEAQMAQRAQQPLPRCLL